MSSVAKYERQDMVPPNATEPSGLESRDRRTPWALVLQLLLILLVVRSFRIEERRGLFELLLFVVLTVAVYRKLPLRWRPSCFLAISLLTFPLAFSLPHVDRSGWIDALSVGATQSAWVIGIGLGLFSLCHVPLSFRWRVGMLAAVAGGLAYWRADAMNPFWAVLGSMFMFRLWIYLRELRRERQPVTWPSRLSYFFLLPNAFFPFFPIVDYRRFRDGFVEDQDGVVAQRGVAWILRGIIHLLLYRAVKIYLLPTPIDLIDFEYLALFLVTNYALYLQISGHFHIITGLLHLFGFDLPRTHDRYFLASSFSDIWRRINIYWKDFLTEHVFYPAYFALRRLPKPAAIVAAVGVTFVATWLFHSWQAFWLLGDFPIATRDAALWLSAGSLVALSSLWQYRAALRGAQKPVEVTPASALLMSLKVVGTFATVSFFWACWTVPRFPQLVAFVATSGSLTSHSTFVVGGALLLVLIAGTLTQLVFDRLRRKGVEPELPLERSAILCVASLVVLAAIGLPQVNRHFGYENSRQIASLQSDAPTAAEAGAELEGYYEGLSRVNLQSDPLSRGVEQDPALREIAWTKVTRERNDIIGREMIPGWNGDLLGVPFQVNRWGMHDHDYSRRKPTGVHRIAVAGSSATMGMGVQEGENFPSLLERRLNADLPQEAPRIEVMNFGSGGYTAFEWSAVLREKVYPFRPDVMCYVVHQGELLGPTRELAKSYVLNYPRPFPCLDEILRDAGIDKETPWVAIDLRLEPHAQKTLACLYRGIVNDCRERQIRPIWVYLPLPRVEGVPEGMNDLLADIARQAGFTVIDLSGWDTGHGSDVLVIDAHYHPNQLGHRLIANRLGSALRALPSVVPSTADRR